MSYYLTNGTSEPTMVSSNQGWYDFTEWIEEQDPDVLTQEFIRKGETDNLEDLLDELEELDDPEDDDVATVFNSLLDFLRTEPDKVILSNGIVEDTEEDDWELMDNFNPNQPRDSQGRFGSGSSGGGTLAGAYKETGGKDTDQPVDKEDVAQIVNEMKDAWGYHAPVQLHDGEGQLYEMEGYSFHAGGNCDLTTGHINIWHESLVTVNSSRHVIAHEMMHGTYERVHQQYLSEMSQIANHPNPKQIIRADGTIKAEAKGQYPTYERLHPLLQNSADLKSDDGITKYSQRWWAEQSLGKTSHHIGVHETLAEIAGIHESTGVIQGSKLYRDLYKATRDEYKVLTGAQKKRKGVGVTVNQLFPASLFTDVFIYLDDDFNPVENVHEATWVRYWKANGNNGWARKEE